MLVAVQVREVQPHPGRRPALLDPRGKCTACAHGSTARTCTGSTAKQVARKHVQEAWQRDICIKCGLDSRLAGWGLLTGCSCVHLCAPALP